MPLKAGKGQPGAARFWPLRDVRNLTQPDAPDRLPEADVRASIAVPLQAGSIRRLARTMYALCGHTKKKTRPQAHVPGGGSRPVVLWPDPMT